MGGELVAVPIFRYCSPFCCGLLHGSLGRITKCEAHSRLIDEKTIDTHPIQTYT